MGGDHGRSPGQRTVAPVRVPGPARGGRAEAGAVGDPGGSRIANGGRRAGIGLVAVAVVATVGLLVMAARSCEAVLENIGGVTFSAPARAACDAGIFAAADRGDLAEVRRLLGAGEVGTTNRDGRTALYCAAAGSGPPAARLGVASFLLDRGADPNQANLAGDAPLLWAADHGEVEMARLLLDRGANVNQANAQDQTPLLRATYGRNTEAALLLLERGADPNRAGHVDPFTEYVLLSDAAARGTAASPPGVPGTLEPAGPSSSTMLQPSSNPAANPSSAATAATTTSSRPALPSGVRLGYPPLVVAASNGDRRLVVALVQHGATVDVLAGPGITPLYAAAQQGDEQVVAALLFAGADPTFGVAPGTISPRAVANLGHHDAAAALLAQAEAQQAGPGG